MSLAAIKKLFHAGQHILVTNHYISRSDHPCFGTKARIVAKVTSSHLWFASDVLSKGSNVPWPTAANVTEEHGVVKFWGFPKAGDLFLTISFPTVVAIEEVTPDFSVENHGSLFILRALTVAAKQWVADHIPADALTWGPDGIVVEPRYIRDIVVGIHNDGLVAV